MLLQSPRTPARTTSARRVRSACPVRTAQYAASAPRTAQPRPWHQALSVAQTTETTVTSATCSDTPASGAWPSLSSTRAPVVSLSRTTVEQHKQFSNPIGMNLLKQLAMVFPTLQSLNKSFLQTHDCVGLPLIKSIWGFQSIDCTVSFQKLTMCENITKQKCVGCCLI